MLLLMMDFPVDDGVDVNVDIDDDDVEVCILLASSRWPSMYGR